MKPTNFYCLIIAIILFTYSPTLFAQERTSRFDQSIELGKVSWYRDYELALQLAKKENKAVLILFQEVPGCATCKNYGDNVLSHPMMVEAIESQFIPLVVFNNKGGNDRLVLNQFNEPSWNNPVVRIINHTGRDLIDRLSGDYSNKSLYNALIAALAVEKKSVPEFITLYGQELYTDGINIREDYFRMFCFWTGEKQLGSVPGILTTEAGFIEGNEVVKVKYDQSVINKQQLEAYASKNQCTVIEDNGNFKKSDRDQKYILQKTIYQYIPLTDMQKTKINSALGNNDDANKFLSPRQLIWLEEIKKNGIENQKPSNDDFIVAWENKFRIN